MRLIDIDLNIFDSIIHLDDSPFEKAFITRNGEFYYFCRISLKFLGAFIERAGIMEQRILVVGDTQKNLNTIGRHLEQYGYDRVELTRTAKEARQKIRSNPPALAIINTQISDGDGYSVCKQIRKMNTGRMKIILLNGLPEMNTAQRAREVGADDFVVKTSDYLFLMDTVRKILLTP